MKHLKNFGLAVMAVLAVAGPGTAPATTLEVGGVPQSKSVELKLSLASGTSAILKDETGTTSDTCTGSELVGKTETTFSATTVGGAAAKWPFTNCSHTTTTLNSGKSSIAWTSGTNGTLSSSGAEVTMQSTFFGTSAVCKTGTGTLLGTLTGKKEGNAIVDINTTLSCGFLGNTTWTGTYTVTSPTGLGVVS